MSGRKTINKSKKNSRLSLLCYKALMEDRVASLMMGHRKRRQDEFYSYGFLKALPNALFRETLYHFYKGHVCGEMNLHTRNHNVQSQTFD